MANPEVSSGKQRIVNVCDREGDIYELFDAAIQDGQIFLIRIAQNRMTASDQHILDVIRKKRCMGRVKTHMNGFGLPEYLCYAFYAATQAVYFPRFCVGGKTCSKCGCYAKTLHCRLGAVMACAHGNSLFV
jgi:hypothetical protein